MPLLGHAVGILARPRQEWQAIAAEATPPSAVAIRYLLPLAALGGIVTIGGSFIRIGAWDGPGGVPGFFAVFGWALLYFVVVPVAVCALTAFVIDGFATMFHGTPNRTQAFKLAAYAYTPILWFLVMMSLLPPNALTALVAMASVAATAYLLFVGSPILMRAPADRAVPYAVVGVLAMFGAAYVLKPLLALARL